MKELFGEDEAISKLLNCRWADRNNREAEFFNLLLPETKLQEWAEKGARISHWMSSKRKHFMINIGVSVKKTKTDILLTYCEYEKSIQVMGMKSANRILAATTSEISLQLIEIIESLIQNS